jgi:hypothetical protein
LFYNRHSSAQKMGNSSTHWLECILPSSTSSSSYSHYPFQRLASIPCSLCISEENPEFPNSFHI